MELNFFFVHFLDTLLHADKIRELKQRRRRRQRERQHSYTLRLAKQQLCTCITLFCTLLFHCHVKVPKGLFTWSGGPRSSGVGYFCFHALGNTKQKKPTPLHRGPPLHVNRVLVTCQINVCLYRKNTFLKGTPRAGHWDVFLDVP